MFKRDSLTTTKKQYVLFWGVTVFMAMYTFILVYPFVWAFMASFMSPLDYQAMLQNKLIKLPDVWQFSNYVEAFKGMYVDAFVKGKIMRYNLVAMASNTVTVALIRTVFSTIFPVCASYCCARYKFFGSKFFFFYGVVFCSIPLYGSASATFDLLYKLNLYDTYGAIVLMSISPFTNFLFYYGFFRSIDKGYSEAAQIDGASDFRIFWQIMLPQVIPAIFVFTLNSFVGFWNDWMTTYMYLPSHPTVAHGIMLLETKATKENQMPLLFASIFTSLVIPLAFFLTFQKQIMNTVYVGGLKG